ncbi:MAG: alanine--tRNA ligase [Bacteroidetes bacterium GWF2_33_16]|nr:MAG: alanine--tRNA ligase [Bacteroidetes bacterium GWE2_32_14]OFY07827.1 MAG: alanine--tRNA ligase [Bacteroidetes bacterium GWF2_33_16]
MNSKEIRNAFLDYFKNKQHTIVPSAPMVIKNDPSLMFTNAGMNQFKDIFLGNKPAKDSRVADSQKCLRVSGKHNDLEEVGHDTYHHTMFEMLGNWSFGDPAHPEVGYFKKEAIEWAYELLIKELGIDVNRVYATVFEGSADDNLDPDNEALDYWKKYLPDSRILYGSKKDNFWEMGDAGPCGPCSEIHVDLRDDEDRKTIDGKTLVNKDNPLVIEIWNLVFIQYNRKANGILEQLPAKHVDTGMGFERLCMVLQGKKSNYDTDVFQPIIQKIAAISGIKYGSDVKADIAMRVIADHLRAISFSIADGQLPSNNKAGYVIRRILRRAVRYGYTFLNFKEPAMNKLVSVLVENMGDAYPELKSQQTLIEKVITEEEQSFLRTLETGIKLLDHIIEKSNTKKNKVIDGNTAFELYDTYGFPLDLTELILKEKGLTVNRDEFHQAMEAQKDRSRSATTITTDDWVELIATTNEKFVGYTNLEYKIKITRYRKIKSKDKELFQLIFDTTPFYAESGGQVGDTGFIISGDEKTPIIDTKKENNLIIHVATKLPTDPKAEFTAVVNKNARQNTENNHTATHLLHFALRKVLGKHIEQKGSLVHPDYLRFDFSHFQKVTSEEIEKVEAIVNELIRKNISLEEMHDVPMKKASDMGAMALFGEKYSDLVRVIKFDESVELCGGTHAHSTGQIGYFKILSEGAISAGIRRIEAITSYKADEFIKSNLKELDDIKLLFNNTKNLKLSVENLLNENSKLLSQIEEFNKEKVKTVKIELIQKIEKIGDIQFIGGIVPISSSAAIKDLAFQLKNEIENLFLVLGAEIDGKATISIMISDNLVKDKKLNAGQLIREIAKEIDGGGGGQPFYATAGGKNKDGLPIAIEKIKQLIKS